MKRIVIFAAALAAATVAAPASAALLLGHSIGIQYLFPNQITVYQDLGSNLVGTDGPTAFPGCFAFSFTDTTATTSGFAFFEQLVSY